jgi:hypothetical protein
LKKESSLSVVIATLGGNSLQATIDSLKSGTLTPDEILVCIPELYAERVNHLSDDIVSIVPTTVKGQVKQRSIGFNKAACELVMQLDDDVLFEKDSLEKMVQCIGQLGQGHVIGPVFYGMQNRLCIHRLKTGLSAVPKNLFDCLFCAAPWGIKKMGKVTSIGINYGVDDAKCNADLIQVDWLPGGCALSFRQDLVLNDYFPFEGKAYCEDIFLSYHRSQAHRRSWVATKIKIFTAETPPDFSWQAVKKIIAIRRYYLRLIHGPKWRLFLYETVCMMRSAFHTLFRSKNT